jgi:hypothetical protein
MFPDLSRQAGLHTSVAEPSPILKAGFGPHDRSPLPNPPPLRTPPLASTDGSATRNLNKTGVRFWI